MWHCNWLPSPTSQRAAQVGKFCTILHYTQQEIQAHAQVLILVQIPIFCNLKKRGLSDLQDMPCLEKKTYIFNCLNIYSQA